MFCASATGIWKMANSAKPKKRGGLRPRTSDMGPNAMGPKTNPYYESSAQHIGNVEMTYQYEEGDTEGGGNEIDIELVHDNANIDTED